MTQPQAQRDLIMLEAWIKHWQDDAHANLTPTETSLSEALDIVQRLRTVVPPLSLGEG